MTDPRPMGPVYGILVASFICVACFGFLSLASVSVLATLAAVHLGALFLGIMGVTGLGLAGILWAHRRAG